MVIVVLTETAYECPVLPDVSLILWPLTFIVLYIAAVAFIKLLGRLREFEEPLATLLGRIIP